MDLDNIYCDGHCVVGKDSIGYARITDVSSNCLMHYIPTNITDSLPIITINTNLGATKAVAVQSADTPNQQINYAETVALYLGLIVAIANKSLRVYTDSVTANAWSCNRIGATIKDPVKMFIISQTIKLRADFEKIGGKVIKIEGKDNPADFGYHNKNILKRKVENIIKPDEIKVKDIKPDIIEIKKDNIDNKKDNIDNKKDIIDNTDDEEFPENLEWSIVDFAEKYNKNHIMKAPNILSVLLKNYDVVNDKFDIRAIKDDVFDYSHKW
jgi:hypothetical protein